MPDGVNSTFKKVDDKNARGEYGVHDQNVDPNACLACERMNEDILRITGSSEHDLANRRARRKLVGEVTTDDDTDKPTS